jgi:hypothetical protein
MQPTAPSKRWEAFYDSARHNDVLDPRTTLMLHLASAMALGCYP